MVSPRKGVYTTGSSSFVPDAFFEAWAKGEKSAPADSNFRASIISSFGLPKDDSYVYHAIASVTLNQVQVAIDAGGQNGLHAWYLHEDGIPVLQGSFMFIRDQSLEYSFASTLILLTVPTSTFCRHPRLYLHLRIHHVHLQSPNRSCLQRQESLPPSEYSRLPLFPPSSPSFLHCTET